MRSRSFSTHRYLPVAAGVAILVLSACSGDGSQQDDEQATPKVDTPKGFTRVKTGSVSYAMPKSWKRDKDTAKEWTRYIDADKSAPKEHTAEIGVHEPQLPKDAEVEDATTFVGEAFPADERTRVNDASSPDIPGASETYRIDYEYPLEDSDFKGYQVSDIGLRAEDGSFTVVRIGGVRKLVDEGTFDQLVDSVRMDVE